MLPHPSWADLTYEEAVEQLAEKAATNSFLKIEKRADPGQGVLGQLGSAWQNMDPAARNAIMGAGAGGLLGAGKGLFSEDGSVLGDALTGGLVGAGIGGGGTLAAQGLQQGFGPAEATKMPVTVGDKTYMLTPEQAAKASKGLQPSGVESAAGGVADWMKDNPVTSGLGGLAAAETVGSNIAREASPGGRGLMDLFTMGRRSSGGSRVQQGLMEALEGHNMPGWLNNIAGLDDIRTGTSGEAFTAAKELPRGIRSRLARMGLSQSGGMGARILKSLGARAGLYGVPLLALAAGGNYLEGQGRQNETNELLRQLQEQS
jgi:hypothetical protein